MRCTAQGQGALRRLRWRRPVAQCAGPCGRVSGLCALRDAGLRRGRAGVLGQGAVAVWAGLCLKTPPPFRSDGRPRLPSNVVTARIRHPTAFQRSVTALQFVLRPPTLLPPIQARTCVGAVRCAASQFIPCRSLPWTAATLTPAFLRKTRHFWQHLCYCPALGRATPKSSYLHPPPALAGPCLSRRPHLIVSFLAAGFLVDTRR